MSGLEVLGAVAAAVQLTQLTAKTVGFVRKISEVGSQYSDLCDEVCLPNWSTWSLAACTDMGV